MINFAESEKFKLEENPAKGFIGTLNDENAHLLGKNFFKICEDFQIEPKDQVVILGQKHLRTIQNWKKVKLLVRHGTYLIESLKYWGLLKISI